MDLQDVEIDALADLLKRLTTRYDNLFQCSFPYSMGFHQAPRRKALVTSSFTCTSIPASAQLHRAEVSGWFRNAGHAPARSHTEQAADRLRKLSEVHYRQTV